MIYITGDTHGKFEHIKRFVKQVQPTLMDTIVILGDVGLNYYLTQRIEENGKTYMMNGMKI